jgi:heptosyltransferase I
MTDAASDVLAVRLSALGDCVLVLGALQALRQACPALHLSWLIDARIYPLFAQVPAIEWLPVTKPALPWDYLRLAWRLRNRRWDVVLAMQANLRVNLLYPGLRARQRIGFDRKRAREGQWLCCNQAITPRGPHLLDDFLAFAACVCPALPPPSWHLPLAPAAQQWAQRLLSTPGPHIIVHPCASRPERTWYAQGYAQVIRHLAREQGARVYLTGGSSPAECAMARAIAAQAPVVDLVGRTDLPQLAALIAGADVVIAPDTAAVHLARAFEVPVVGLYASVPASLSGPYGRSEYCVDVYEEAHHAIRGRYSQPDLRRPQRLRQGQPMRHIQPPAVIAAASRALDRRRPIATEQ